MAGLDPAIHVFGAERDVDARLKAGHDGGVFGEQKSRIMLMT
jgi:hypothetical protein